jgi:hypothetical protein
MMTNDATIETVLPGLADPISFVRGVFNNVCDWKHLTGSGFAFVRVAVVVVGVPPDYRVASTADDPRRDAGPFRAFSGTSHKLLDWARMDLRDHNWSVRQTSCSQVETLLAQICGAAKRPHSPAATIRTYSD